VLRGVPGSLLANQRERSRELVSRTGIERVPAEGPGNLRITLPTWILLEALRHFSHKGGILEWR
jgi:hypothetical protein